MQYNFEFSLASKVKLNDGIEIPWIGLGTYIDPRAAAHIKGGLKGVDDSAEDELIIDSIACALKNGYTHIDSAQVYDTERLLMSGIAKGGKKREDIFITTKLSTTIRDPIEARKSLEESCRQLGGYIDLCLMHSPVTKNKGKDVKECYQVMMDLKKQGKCFYFTSLSFSIVCLQNSNPNACILHFI